MEKKHRLDESVYIGKLRATFTVCVEDRQPLFKDKAVVNVMLQILKQIFEKYHLLNWIYTFMPDHLHLIFEGVKDNSNLLKAMHMFKQKAGYWLKINKPGFKLQKDFYDRVHRQDVVLVLQMLYIAENPVRSGLVKEWQEFENTGSLSFDLNVEMQSADVLKP